MTKKTRYSTRLLSTVEHVKFARSTPAAAPPLAHTTLRYPCRSCEATMAKTYQCMCSKCYGASKSKYITKRTVEAHIWRDREILQSTSISNTDLVDFLHPRIQETLQVLSGVCGGLLIPDTESDLDGSCPAGSEGAQIYSFHIFDEFPKLTIHEAFTSSF
jgi:hypothetical protein